MISFSSRPPQLTEHNAFQPRGAAERLKGRIDVKTWSKKVWVQQEYSCGAANPVHTRPTSPIQCIVSRLILTLQREILSRNQLKVAQDGKLAYI